MLGTYRKKKQLLLLRGPARPAERVRVFFSDHSQGLDAARGEDWEPGSRHPLQNFRHGRNGITARPQDCFGCTVGDDWRRERKTSRLVRRLLSKWERNHLEGEFKIAYLKYMKVVESARLQLLLSFREEGDPNDSLSYWKNSGTLCKRRESQRRNGVSYEQNKSKASAWQPHKVLYPVDDRSKNLQRRLSTSRGCGRHLQGGERAAWSVLDGERGSGSHSETSGSG